MAYKRWITGEEILERWQAAPFELVEAILSKGLVPVDLDTGKRFEWKDGESRTAKNSLECCFFCDKSGSNPVCYYTWKTDENPFGDPPSIPIYCSDVDGEMSDGWRGNYLVFKSKQFNFSVAEVEAYEQAHSLGPKSNAQEDSGRARCARPNGWITGEEIIRRWNAMPFELYGPMERGELVPVRPEDGARLTKALAPCLYCDGGGYIDDPSWCTIKDCRHVSFGCGEWLPEKRAQRISKANFVFEELLKYEERTGIGPGRPPKDDDKWMLDEDALGPGQRIEDLPDQDATKSQNYTPRQGQETSRKEARVVPRLAYGAHERWAAYAHVRSPIVMEWITGEQILTRWRALPFQLVDAWERGLGTYRMTDGVRQEHGRSCLDCSAGTIQGFPSYYRAHEYCSRECSETCLCHGDDRPRASIEDLGDRLREAFFDLAEVEEFEQMVGISSPIYSLAETVRAVPGESLEPVALEALNSVISPDVSPLSPAIPHSPHNYGKQNQQGNPPSDHNFKTPEELVAACEAEWISNLKELARRVDDVFTGKQRLSPRALGDLLPANPGMIISAGGQRSQGKRLRGEKP